MENFKKYYKFPLKADNMGIYVRTADYEMAFDVPRDERAAWPEMGDASYLRQKGRRR